ncbi:hypothetical protein DN068_12845 [Taibaiella soli]|uniref:VWFA domain-containing protein n=2 Tax=Taibaiella soli TaxID=1649169 RepID=A0A2W2ABS5_9BACT|nr:hypothetical protein DN068_12845 [Taibaiella soli]
MLSGCALLQRKIIVVLKTPHSENYVVDGDTLIEGYALNRNYWIAYSDRNPNATRTSRENEMPLKKLSFMEPVCVVQEKGDYVKILKYNADVDLAETKGNVSRKTARNYGWIKKEHLLLWPASLQNSATRYTVKAVTHFGGNAILNQPQRFITNDSLLLFTTPSLQTPSDKKISAGKIVYLYKQSQDGKSVLIGSESLVTPENANQIMLGWISKDAVAIWGARTAFNLYANAPDSIGLYRTEQELNVTDVFKPLLNSNGLRARSTFENIFPVRNKNCYNSKTLQTGYLENIMDYTHNSVYNVLGQSIDYQKYQKIVSDGDQINIVFVFDISDNNKKYFPLIKSVIQDLQVYFDTTNQLRNCRFGAVTYRHNTHDGDTVASVLPLSRNLQQVEKYIDKKFAKNLYADESIYQPLFAGLNEACNMLQPVKDQTNIIAVIGTTGNDDAATTYSMEQVIKKIIYVQARMLFFQTINKTADAYNDFMLDAEKIIFNSATSIAELKKQKLVDINDVITTPSYNISNGDSGIYSLDYPRQSMTQGFAVFPKKGTVMQAGVFRKCFDSLAKQVTSDNRNVSQKLTEYFRTIGIKSTSFRPEFAGYTEKVNLNPDMAKSFTTSGNSFFIPAYVKAEPGSLDMQNVSFGLFLNEAEYDKQMELFYHIYAKTASGEKFRKKKACRRYTRFIKHYLATNKIHTDEKVKWMTLGNVLYSYTGFISPNLLYNKVTLYNLKSLSKEKTLNIFNSYKYAADAMQEKKNTARVRINNNGHSYYWISEDMMPGTVQMTKAE